MARDHSRTSSHLVPMHCLRHNSGRKHTKQDDNDTWGVILFDAKATPGWDNTKHPAVWLQPIATILARITFREKLDVIGWDCDQVLARYGTFSDLCTKSIHPVQAVDQVSDDVAMVLVNDPDGPNNYGIHGILRTSEKTLARNDANDMFWNLTDANIDDKLQEFAQRIVVEHRKQKWPTPANTAKARTHADRKPWMQLPLNSGNINSTTDLLGLSL